SRCLALLAYRLSLLLLLLHVRLTFLLFLLALGSALLRLGGYLFAVFLYMLFVQVGGNQSQIVLVVVAGIKFVLDYFGFGVVGITEHSLDILDGVVDSLLDLF